jgi:hypothetical protein
MAQLYDMRTGQVTGDSTDDSYQPTVWDTTAPGVRADPITQQNYRVITPEEAAQFPTLAQSIKQGPNGELWMPKDTYDYYVHDPGGHGDWFTGGGGYPAMFTAIAAGGSLAGLAGAGAATGAEVGTGAGVAGAGTEVGAGAGTEYGLGTATGTGAGIGGQTAGLGLQAPAAITGPAVETGIGSGAGYGLAGGTSGLGITGAGYGTAAGAAAAGLTPTAAAGATATGTALSRILDNNPKNPATTADWASVLGTAGATGLGMYSANQQANTLADLAEKNRLERAPYLSASQGWLANPESYMQGPGAAAMKSTLAGLSSKFGNPIGSPAAMEISNQAALQNWQNAVTGIGNMGLSGADTRANLGVQAAGAQGNVLTNLAGGISNVINPTPTLADLLKQYRQFSQAGASLA